MTPQALIIKINSQKNEARKKFAGNPYVTIHDNPTMPQKTDPFTVWVDLNFPIYVIRNGKSVKTYGIKDISIRYPMNYPEQRPIIMCSSEHVCSIHAWHNGILCLHSDYVAAEHNLVKEICNLLALAANCPETINFNSVTPDMREYVEWTKNGIKNGTLPTVPYKILTASSNSNVGFRRRVF